MIYFLRAGCDGPVKIGYAKRSVEDRVAGFQTGHYETLVVIRKTPGSRLDEAKLHRYFANQRLRGEWFKFCEEMMTIDVSTIQAGDVRFNIDVLGFDAEFTELRTESAVDYANISPPLSKSIKQRKLRYPRVVYRPKLINI